LGKERKERKSSASCCSLEIPKKWMEKARREGNKTFCGFEVFISKVFSARCALFCSYHDYTCVVFVVGRSVCGVHA